VLDWAKTGGLRTNSDREVRYTPKLPYFEQIRIAGFVSGGLDGGVTVELNDCFDHAGQFKRFPSN